MAGCLRCRSLGLLQGHDLLLRRLYRCGAEVNGNGALGLLDMERNHFPERDGYGHIFLGQRRFDPVDSAFKVLGIHVPHDQGRDGRLGHFQNQGFGSLLVRDHIWFSCPWSQ